MYTPRLPSWPLFKWVNFASGGMIGLKGDGKLVLGITLVAITIYISVLIKTKWLMAGVLAVQAWSTAAMFWMAALIWKVNSIVDSPGIKDNPFAGLLAIQVSPGAGLYVGLIGALVAATTLAFVAGRRLLVPYLITQALSVGLGLLLVFFVGPSATSAPSKHETAEPKPTLQPREWYRAKWPGVLQSRELDTNFREKSRKLKVTVEITTEPDVPIRELHGRLVFVKDGQVVYATQVAEKPDVSFTNWHLVFLRIPYDDNDASHRTLRFAKDSELTPVFTVSKIVLADGTEKTFD
jgi:hypothetical protein